MFIPTIYKNVFIIYTYQMTEMTELDIDLQRQEQNIQNLLDDFDFFLEHLDEEAQK